MPAGFLSRERTIIVGRNGSIIFVWRRQYEPAARPQAADQVREKFPIVQYMFDVLKRENIVIAPHMLLKLVEVPRVPDRKCGILHFNDRCAFGGYGLVARVPAQAHRVVPALGYTDCEGAASASDVKNALTIVSLREMLSYEPPAIEHEAI